jgi:hypothetical protein
MKHQVRLVAVADLMIKLPPRHAPAMATQREIAQFFRLALRLRLVDTAAVERWVDSVVAAEPVVRFPFTDLAGASLLPSSTVDELLGQVTGHSELHVPGRIVLALLRRRLRGGTLTPDVAIKLALEAGSTEALTEDERYRADVLDDALWLAANGRYGSLDNVRREITVFLERYAEFDQQIPLAAHRGDLETPHRWL